MALVKFLLLPNSIEVLTALYFLVPDEAQIYQDLVTRFPSRCSVVSGLSSSELQLRRHCLPQASALAAQGGERSLRSPVSLSQRLLRAN